MRLTREGFTWGRLSITWRDPYAGYGLAVDWRYRQVFAVGFWRRLS